MLPEQFIWIGVLVNLIGCVWYVKDIIYGGTKPNLISWFLWMLAPLIAGFLQIKAGAGLSVLATFMAGFGPLLVIILSIFRKNSLWKIKYFRLCMRSTIFTGTSFIRT